MPRNTGNAVRVRTTPLPNACRCRRGGGNQHHLLCTRNRNLYPNTPANIKRANRALSCIKLVTIQGKSFRALEDGPFQNFIDEESPETAPNDIITTIKSMIEVKADEIRTKIYGELQQRQISLKIDFATFELRSFICIHAQFVKEGIVTVRTLLTEEVLISDTITKYDCFKEAVQSVLCSYNIASKNIYCITDNGQNFKKLRRLSNGSLKVLNIDADIKSDETEKLELNEEVPYDGLVDNLTTQGGPGDFKTKAMPCAIHTLQLAVQDMIQSNKEVQVLLNRVRDAIKVLKNCKMMTETPNPPVQDVPAIWSTTYRMLLNFKNMCDGEVKTMSLLKLFDTSTWQTIKNLIGCLYLIHETASNLQKKQMTLGDFFLEWLLCKDNIKQLNTEMSQYLLNSMEAREVSLRQNEVMLEVLYMDVRFNAMLSDIEALKAQKILLKTLQQIQSIRGIGIVHFEPFPVSDEPEELVTVGDNCLVGIDRMIGSLKRQRDLERQSRNVFVLQVVRKMRRIPLNADVLHYWRLDPPLGDLSELANCVLATPASQVSSEKLFNSISFMLDPETSFMRSRTLNEILMIRNNENLLE